MLELQLRDIEVRLTVAELDADLEALRAKHGDLADDGLAGDVDLVAAAGPGSRDSYPFAFGRPRRASRASHSGSFRSLSAATPGATARARATRPSARAGPRASGPRMPFRAHRNARARPRAPGRARRTARAGPRAVAY